jgi:hypothetical protein
MSRFVVATTEPVEDSARGLLLTPPFCTQSLHIIVWFLTSEVCNIENTHPFQVHMQIAGAVGWLEVLKLGCECLALFGWDNAPPVGLRALLFPSAVPQELQLLGGSSSKPLAVGLS